MNSFDYIRPATIADAVAAAAEPGAAYLAAGTNLLDLMKGGITRPRCLVDVTRLPGLDRIEHLAGGGCGSARSCAMPIWPMMKRLPAAFPRSRKPSSPAPRRNSARRDRRRQSATAHALRLFLDTASACNKREPGAGCEARGGASRLHAVLGWSEGCIATHPSDFCVPLAALDATVEIEGKAGRRKVALEDFHRLPGDAPDRESVLEPGELIVAVGLPAVSASFAAHARYLKVRERTSYAFAVVSAAAALRIENGAIVAARIALGGVAMKPWRARAAERPWTAHRPMAPPFAAPPRRRWRTRNPPGTTNSKSNSRDGS